MICLIDSLCRMRHVRHNIRHRNSHSTFAYTLHSTRKELNAIFDFMQMRNRIMIMRNENSIAFDEIMQKVPRDWISRNFLRIRQVKKIEFDFYFGGKTNLIFELQNSCKKSNATFLKNRIGLEI